MPPTWNPAQYLAITAQNPRLLVSASAGTGKTEVMTERIAALAAHHQLSMDRVAVLTFTRAAAAEMRSRITAKLREAARLDPRLHTQLDLIPSAAICTIDALCQTIVRTHFEAADIDPSFRVLDAAELAQVEKAAIDAAMEKVYADTPQDEELSALTAKFTDEELQALIQTLSRYMDSLPDPESWLRECSTHVYTVENLPNEPFAGAMLSCARRRLLCARALLNQAVDGLASGAIDGIFTHNIAKDVELIDALSQAAASGFTPFMEALRCKPTFSRKASVKKGSFVAGADSYETLRSKYKEIVEKLKKHFLSFDDRMVADLNAMQPALRGLCQATELYRALLWSKKAEKKAADFGDVQRLALQILRDEKLGAHIAAAYDAVFVDECQDVSPLQEELLTRLSREDSSSFWVGDIKQSIYRFRRADAGLFLRKLQQYDTHPSARERLIILSENFRSVTAVHSAVNRVFSHVMCKNITDIDYDADAFLTRETPTQGDLPVEIHVFPQEGLKEHHTEDEAMQLYFVARDIQRRVGHPMPGKDGTPGEPLRYGDIMILTPVAAGVLHTMENVLKDAGIPCVSAKGSNAADSMEVRQVLAFLECLLNGQDDFALLAALRSPLLRFTEPELAAVRLCKNAPDATFHQALEEAALSAEEPLRSKCEGALQLLERERFYAFNQPVCQYLWDLMDRSGYLLYVSSLEGGAQRRANLEFLCAKAADWDANRTEGITAFVEAMRTLAASKEGVSPLSGSGSDNAVQLMTIHKSKGLGARLVYVVMMNHAFQSNGNHGENMLAANREIGLSLQYRNEAERVKRPTALMEAVKLQTEHAERAEKARLLYVAMTRAKERLVLCGSVKKLENPAGLVLSSREEHTEAGVENAQNYLEWLLQCAAPGDGYYYTGDVPPFAPEAGIAFAAYAPFTGSAAAPSAPSLQYIFHLVPEYPPQHHEGDPGALVPNALTQSLPAVSGSGFSGPNPQPDPDPLLPGLEFPPATHKVGVTALVQYRSLGEELPPEEADGEETREQKREPLFPKKLRFMPEKPKLPALLQEDKEGVSAARRGTLTHLLLELIDLDQLRELRGPVLPYVEWEIQRMVDRRQFSQKEAALIDARQIADLMEGPLGRRILESIWVQRELLFTLRAEEPPRTLIQGIIDLCFIEEKSWVLVDFKTDHVNSVQELAERYRMQVEIYRKALETATHLPVREVLLYSLRLRQAVRV